MFHLDPQNRVSFPNLNGSNYTPTSPVDRQYNCIAWAAGDTGAWWWPDPMGQYFWPVGVPRVETISAYVHAYASYGYVSCEDGSLEVGFEKVAIYALNGVPKHAARQLPSGRWTSKCGQNIDMEHHTLDALEGPFYGRVIRFLKRPVISRNP